MIDYKHIQTLQQEVGMLQHEFNKLQQKMSGHEWFEVVRRDLAASMVRRQDELRSYIFYSRQVIQEREVRAMTHNECYVELQNEWISEEDFNSEDFEAKYSRYSLDEIQEELIAKRAGK